MPENQKSQLPLQFSIFQYLVFFLFSFIFNLLISVFQQLDFLTFLYFQFSAFQYLDFLIFLYFQFSNFCFSIFRFSDFPLFSIFLFQFFNFVRY